jgi:tetratricopeptide (TPR) repeat protein
MKKIVSFEVDFRDRYVGILTYNGYRPSEAEFWEMINGGYFQNQIAASETLIPESYYSIENNTGLDARIKDAMRKNGITFCETHFANDYDGFTYGVNYSFDAYKTFGFICMDSAGAERYNEASAKTSAEAYFQRGLAYGEKAEYDHAIADFTRVIELDPKSADAYIGRGLAYGEKDDCDNAVADFTRAIELDPESADAYLFRGMAYEEKGDTEKAEADYAKAKELGYEETDAGNTAKINIGGTMWAYKGTSAVDVGPDIGVFEYDFFAVSGEEDFRALLDYYAAQWRRFDYFFDDMETHGDNTELSPNVKAAMKEHGANVSLNVYEEDNLANGLKTRYMVINREMPEGAYDTYFLRFFYFIANSAQRYYEQGRTFEKAKCSRAAIACYTEAIKIDSESSVLFQRRGDAYLALRQFDRAIADYTQAVELDPDDAEWYHARGDAYKAKGDTEKAEADYAKAKELGGRGVENGKI